MNKPSFVEIVVLVLSSVSLGVILSYFIEDVRKKRQFNQIVLAAAFLYILLFTIKTVF